MSMGLLLGLSSLYYLFGRSSSSREPRALAQALAQELSSLWTAAWLGSLYWVTQLSAALYPGSLPVDPEFGQGFPQAYICVVLLSMVVVGTGLEHRRLKRMMEVKNE